MKRTHECCVESAGDAPGPHVTWSEPSDFNHKPGAKSGWIWVTDGFNGHSPHFGVAYVYVTRCPFCGAELPKEK